MIHWRIFTRESKMDYKKMSFIAGLVIFLGFVILLFSIIGLAEKRIFFTRDYIIYAKFTDVVGLQDHAKVFMRGYRIGWTKGIQFEKDGVTVRIDINKKFRVPQDSKFDLSMVSLLGEKAITIKPGISSNFLQQGDVVTGENRDLMAKAERFFNQIQATLEADQTREKVKELSQSIALLHSFLGKMHTKMDDLDMVEISGQIKSIGSAGESIKKLADSNADSIAIAISQFNTVARNMNQLTEELTKISSKINHGEGSVGALVKNDDYIKNLNKTIEELSVLIEDFKKNPKKYIDLSIF